MNEADGVQGSRPLPINLLEILQNVDFLPRLLSKDETLWAGFGEVPFIVLGLGWIDAAKSIVNEAVKIKSIAEKYLTKTYETLVIIGMGGSSVAREIFFNNRSSCQSPLRIIVINSLSIAELIQVATSVDIDQTLFLIISGSGETLETKELFDFFWGRFKTSQPQENFIIITATNSPLSVQAKNKTIDQIHNFPGELWGRFRVLGLPGMLPAILAGVDIEAFASDVFDATRDFLTDNLYDNEAVQLGVQLSALYQSGKKRIFLLHSRELSGLTEWISELIAESTNKNGMGFVAVPVTLESFQLLGKNDICIFVETGEIVHFKNPQNAKTSQPFTILNGGGTLAGREIVRWGVAMLVFCYLNRINPFIEPQFNELMSHLRANLKKRQNNERVGMVEETRGDAIQDIFRSITGPDYIVLHTFFDPATSTKQRLVRMQEMIQKRYGVPCLLYHGTYYMHSIGQQFKGGPNLGIFIQFVLGDKKIPWAISASELSALNILISELIDSDYELLERYNRRVIRLDLSKDPDGQLDRFLELALGV